VQSSGLAWPGDTDRQAVECRAGAADDFAGPQASCQHGEEAILEIAKGTEEIIAVGVVVGVHATPRKFTLKSGIARDQRPAGTDSEGFSLKAREQSHKRFQVRRDENERSWACIAKCDSMSQAVVTHAFAMAEEVQHPGLATSQCCQHGRPGSCSFRAANRLAALRLDQLESDCLHIGAQIHWFDFKLDGKRIHSGSCLRFGDREAPLKVG